MQLPSHDYQEDQSKGQIYCFLCHLLSLLDGVFCRGDNDKLAGKTRNNSTVDSELVITRMFVKIELLLKKCIVHR